MRVEGVAQVEDAAQSTLALVALDDSALMRQAAAMARSISMWSHPARRAGALARDEKSVRSPMMADLSTS